MNQLHFPSVVVAQIGARRQYAVPLALQRENLLAWFYTDFMGVSPLANATLRSLAYLTGNPAVSRHLDRPLSDIPRSCISDFPFLYLTSRLRSNGQSDFRSRVNGWVTKNAAFGRRVARAGFTSANTVYGFNTASVELFEAASKQGLACILDQTNAGWRSEWHTRHREWEAWQDWEAPPASEVDIEPLITREEREWAMADLILCGSTHVVDQIATTAAIRKKCSIIIPGRAKASSRPRPTATHRNHLHVLFAGTLELRKGIQYLVNAAQALSGENVHVRAVGPSSLLPHRTAAIRGVIDVIGKVPYSDMSEHFAWADVLILPSLSEGSAGVCTEALSHGVPVITTREAGSPVVDGQTGLIIPSGSSDAIEDALLRLSRDPDLLQHLTSNASKATDNLSIETYGSALRKALTTLR